MKFSRIYLVGFMGSGKTTLGKKLATRIGYRFIDLDQLTAEANGVASVAELIEREGIAAFRKAEAEALRTITEEKVLVATGGGTPCFYDSIDYMLENGLVIYLQIEPKAIMNRLLTTDRQQRPLIKDYDNAELEAYIIKTLHEREPYYLRAQLTINPLRDKIEEITMRVGEYI